MNVRQFVHSQLSKTYRNNFYDHTSEKNRTDGFNKIKSSSAASLISQQNLK